MLTITITSPEMFNHKTNEFIDEEVVATITLEHSLVAISKWEMKYHKPFLTDEPKTTEEFIYYIKCMTITQNVKPEVYNLLNRKNIEQIRDYMEDSMTATWFSESDKRGGPSRQKVSSELIYCWMFSNQIPIECQKWHINRLLTLIRVCSIENAPNKSKKSAKDIAARNAALNAQRRKQFHSNG